MKNSTMSRVHDHYKDAFNRIRINQITVRPITTVFVKLRVQIYRRKTIECRERWINSETSELLTNRNQ